MDLSLDLESDRGLELDLKKGGSRGKREKTLQDREKKLKEGFQLDPFLSEKEYLDLPSDPLNFIDHFLVGETIISHSGSIGKLSVLIKLINK